MIQSARLTSKNIFLIFYAAFLITGFLVYKDYGISWDESACRADLGELNWNFITKGDYKSLVSDDAKYHGPAFEIILYGVERIFNIKETRDIFFTRHLITFLLFAVSVLFFYRICKKLSKSEWIALLGPVMLVLSPRIFADSFYNSKDLAFASLVVINIFTSIRFLEKKNASSAIWNAVISAFVIDVRIMGVIIPAITGIFLLIDFLKNADRRKQLSKLFILSVIILIGSIILLWPVLWRNPLNHFVSAFTEMSKFPWTKNIFYLGQSLPATSLPWHYIPVWILVTTPVLYTICFFAGVIGLFKKFLQKRNLTTIEWLAIFIIIIPISAIIIMNSVVYDGWRHLYFIYSAIILVSLSGIEFIYFLIRKSIMMNYLISSTIIIYLIFILNTMITLHPYENVYFNSLAGKDLSVARLKFEVDYWGLSYREAIGYILKNDSSDHISLSAAELPPVFFNSYLFSAQEQRRLSVRNEMELSDYYITAYRSGRNGYKRKPEFNLRRDNGIILSVFNLKGRRIDLTKQKSVMHFYNTFEKSYGDWANGKTGTFDITDTVNNVGQFNSSVVYGTGLSIKPLEIMCDSSYVNYLIARLRINSQYPISASFVLEIVSDSEKVYFWQSYKLQTKGNNQWAKTDVEMLFPRIQSTTDIIRIYIWNPEKKKFIVDDINIDFITVSNDTISDLKRRLFE